MTTTRDDATWRDLDGTAQPCGKLLTFGQVADRLGIGVQDVRRRVRTEQCPTLRVGHATRIPAGWVDGQTVTR